MWPALNFPEYQFRFKNTEKNILIFDPIRKKFIVCTPEEWVRAHTLQFLIQEKSFSPNLINVEKKIMVRGMDKRYDVVAYNPNGDIHLIVECKAPNVPITQATFDQIARYNFSSRATYLMVTNGLEHYYCQMDWEKEEYIFLRELPEYLNPNLENTNL